jgi:hypothetical protein
VLSGLEILHELSRFGIIHKKVDLFECEMRKWNGKIVLVLKHDLQKGSYRINILIGSDNFVAISFFRDR